MTSHSHATAADVDADDRPMRPAMLRGWQRVCPACGEGRMMQGYLKVRDHCPACGEELHHQRADDGPAYLTILIVGKTVVPLMAWAFVVLHPEPIVLALAASTLAISLSLYLLPRLKGVLVGIQWSRRMHGFGGDASD